MQPQGSRFVRSYPSDLKVHVKTQEEIEEELEQALLSRKAPTCGFAEVLMPTGTPRKSERLTVKYAQPHWTKLTLVRSPIQRYRLHDLQDNALENQKTVERLKSILKEQEAARQRFLEEKDNLIARSVVCNNFTFGHLLGRKRKLSDARLKRTREQCNFKLILCTKVCRYVAIFKRIYCCRIITCKRTTWCVSWSNLIWSCVWSRLWVLLKKMVCSLISCV